MNEGSDWIDPLYELRIRRTGTWVSKDWRVGCLNGDVPADDLWRAQWVDADTVEVLTSDSRRFLVDVNPTSGRPERRFRVGDC